jgi:ATP-binding cassette subfamily B protein
MMLPPLFSDSRRRDFTLLVMNGALQATGAVATALLTRDGFDRLITGGGAVSVPFIMVVGGLIGIAAGVAWLRYREHLTAERLGQSYVHAVRMRLFRHLLHIGPGVVGRLSRGAITLRFVGDLSALRRWVSRGIARLLVGGVVIVFSLVALTLIEPTLAAAVGAGVAAAGLLSLGLGNRLQAATRAVRRRRGRLAAHLTDRLAHLHLVQACAQEQREAARFKMLSRRQMAAFLRQARTVGLLRSLADAGASAASLAAFVVGAQLVALQMASPGTAVAAMLVAGLLAPRLQELGRIYEYWTAARIAREKQERLLRLRPAKPGTRRGGRSLPQERGELVLRGVALNGLLPALDLTLTPGDRLCIVGDNGAGKSTLLQVMAGLRRPDHGRVELNGQSLKVSDNRQVRRAIALVSCDQALLRGSLRANLTYGLGGAAGNGELADVIERCDLGGLIERLPQGLETQISELQTRFSAGERMRIALARGLITQPQVLLLDEVESHLDSDGLWALGDIIRSFDGPLAFVTHHPERLGVTARILQLSAGKPAAITELPGPAPAPTTTTLKVVT